MIAFYTLTKGKHPFGESKDDVHYNILSGNPVNLKDLKDPLAKDLVSWMLTHARKDRPSAEDALKHPYFMSEQQRFTILCEKGNVKEIKKKEEKSDVVKELTKKMEELTEHMKEDGTKEKPDWRTRLDSDVLDYLSTDFLKKPPYSHKYTESWTDCLRLIRNVREHWDDYERKEVEATKVGNPQSFFLHLFPDLLLTVYKLDRSCGWSEVAGKPSSELSCMADMLKTNVTLKVLNRMTLGKKNNEKNKTRL